MAKKKAEITMYKAPRTGADKTMRPSDFCVGMAGTLEQ
jgi:hypothetical protein